MRALAAAERRLAEKWDAWEATGLIPTERFPEGNDMRPAIYGMPRWCDPFLRRWRGLVPDCGWCCPRNAGRNA